jgi:hypothetical protein
MKNVKWILHPLMVWGAVLGFLIFGALGEIRGAWRHQGAGYVSHEEPGGTVKVGESDYKRHVNAGRKVRRGSGV